MAGNYLIVQNTRCRGEPGKIVQRWHLGADRAVEVDYHRALTVGGGANLELRWLGIAPSIRVLNGTTEPMLGSRSLAMRDWRPVLNIESSVKAEEATLTTLSLGRGSEVESLKVRAAEANQTAFLISVARALVCGTFELKHHVLEYSSNGP